MPFNIAGTSRSTGKPFSFFKQNVYAHIGGAFPFKFEIMLEDQRNAYPIGKYEVDCKSFEVDARNNLVFGRNMVLLALAPQNNKAA